MGRLIIVIVVHGKQYVIVVPTMVSLPPVIDLIVVSKYFPS